MELSGKVAVVTGASRGIGAATAQELARRGAHVVITGRTEGGLEETDDAIRTAGGTATLLPLDLRDGAALDLLGPLGPGPGLAVIAFDDAEFWGHGWGPILLLSHSSERWRERSEATEGATRGDPPAPSVPSRCSWPPAP